MLPSALTLNTASLQSFQLRSRSNATIGPSYNNEYFQPYVSNIIKVSTCLNSSVLVSDQNSI